MAKAKVRYRTRAAKVVRRKARSSMGAIKPIAVGAAAGAAGAVAAKYIGPYGHPAACIGIGVLMKEKTLQVIGGRELGAALATQFVGNGNGGGGIGARY